MRELWAALVGMYAAMYADNYFSSPALMKQLLEKKTYYTGVVRKDRKHMPFKDVSQKCGKKTKTQELQRGRFSDFPL